MMTRRTLLIAGAAGLALPKPIAAALPVPEDGRLGFSVLRDGSPIGSHVLGFEPSVEGLVVRVAVDLRIGLGPFTLFRYRHRATETWAGGQVVALESETDDDGETYRVTGRREADGFVVAGSRVQPYVAPADAMPATHWNRRMLDGPFINTQDGRLMRPRVTELGTEIVPTATGARLAAERFALSGEVTLDTWYEPAPRWAGLRFRAKDGSEIRYERA
jgi:hypothetical protein